MRDIVACMTIDLGLRSPLTFTFTRMKIGVLDINYISTPLVHYAIEGGLNLE